MTEWKEYKLEEIIEVFIDYRGKTPQKSSFGIPLITAKVVKEGRILPPNEFIPEEDYDSWMTRGLPEINDVVLTTEAPLGEVALIKDNRVALAQRIITMRGKRDIVDNIFLKYYFQSKQGQYELSSRASGTTVFGIKAEVLKKVPVFLPPLIEQCRIAATLSSLDDKIDLLHRENATLEQMAETLFRQWFVVEAKEEWEEGKLGDWVVIKRGGSPRPINDYISSSGYRWLKISDVTNLNSPYIFQTKEYIKESGLQKTVYLSKGSLVLSNSATPGIPKILCVDSCIHDGWLYFPKSIFSRFYLYLLFKYIREDLVNLGNGSIFTNLKTDILKDYKVVKPDTKTLENFDHQVYPIFDKLYSNDIQIQTLIQMRDGLLPRLMGGEVKI